MPHGNFKDAKNKGVCKNCGISFESYDSEFYCSRNCYLSHRKKNSIKHNHKCSCGKTTDYRTKKCRLCFSRSLIGKKLTPEHRAKVIKHLRPKYGNLCNFWVDGSSKITRLIRNCEKNKSWRLSVFERDNYTCQKCGIRGGYLEVNHIKPFRAIFNNFIHENNSYSVIDNKETLLKLSFNHADFWDISNGETLCRGCHLKTETHGRPRRIKLCA